MTAEADATIRNAGLLIVQRALHVAAALLFAVFLPRLMGPETFGRYALITSISMWFALFTGLGAVSMMSRFVPQFVLLSDQAGLQKLVSRLLVWRTMSGVFAAALYFVIAAFWLRELDWVALAFVAASLMLRTAGNLFFALFLGLNQAARWGLGELLRRWLSFAFVLPGFLAGGLRGACFGLLLANMGVFVAGSWWGRAYIRRSELGFDRSYLLPFLRVGVSFAAGNILLAFTQRSGEALVRVSTADYAQVGYFGVAYGIYLTAAHAFWQLALAFSPLLIALREQQQIEAVRQWVERLLKWMSIAGVGALMAVLVLGQHLVPLVLGAEFAPVARDLLPLTAALLTLAIGCAGRLLTLTYDRPGVAVAAGSIELLTFWALGLPLSALEGSLGACLAILAASALYAAFITWRMSRHFRYSLRTAIASVALGALFLPLVWIHGSLPVQAGLYLLFLLAYGGLLLTLHIITPGEFAAMRQALARRRVGVDADATP